MEHVETRLQTDCPNAFNEWVLYKKISFVKCSIGSTNLFGPLFWVPKNVVNQKV